MSKERTKRTAQTRQSEERSKPWTPPSVLPEPEPRDGWVHRWIRTSMAGQSDNRNVSMRFREGWEPVKSEDYPEFEGFQTDVGSKYPGNIEIGGLLLCRTAEETMKQRSEYYLDKAQNQMNGVEQSYMRENDPRMPLSKLESSTRVTFGKGGPSK
jgi:hypothetical protein|tara:strand:+ start:442 stop:906 length:465 start_codon:yes stop_codon:yes gene_type:complete